MLELEVVIVSVVIIFVGLVLPLLAELLVDSHRLEKRSDKLEKIIELLTKEVVNRESSESDKENEKNCDNGDSDKPMDKTH